MLHNSIHLHDDATLDGHVSQVGRGWGYLRLHPMPVAPSLCSVIHAKAPELRRLAAACTALADELDPPTYDDAYDAALLTSYGRIADLYENSQRMGETA